MTIGLLACHQEQGGENPEPLGIAVYDSVKEANRVPSAMEHKLSENNQKEERSYQICPKNHN